MEASDEALEILERQLASDDVEARRGAVSGIYSLFQRAGRNEELAERSFEALLRTAKTDRNCEIAVSALCLVSRIGLLNRSFTFTQRERILGLVISALRSDDPYIRRRAPDAVLAPNPTNGISLVPKEIDGFIEMYRLLADHPGYNNVQWNITTGLGNISRNPHLSSGQIERICETLEGRLLFRAFPENLPQVFNALAILAANPNASEGQRERIVQQIRQFSDYANPTVRNSARFHLVYIALSDRFADDREIAKSIGPLLNAGIGSNARGGPSVLERLLAIAEVRNNPVHIRRNTYRAVRACVESGNLPSDLSLDRLLDRVRSDLRLERDHSVRAEAKALLSIIPQP